MSANAFLRFEERPGAIPAPAASEIAGSGAERAGLTPLETLCDLACFGLVAGLGPVKDKAELRPSRAWVPPGGMTPAVGGANDRAAAPDGARRVRFVDLEPERLADLPNYCVSATARAVAARLHLPLVSAPLLALIALADRLPDGPLLVLLPRSQPQAFLDRLKPSARAIVAERIAVLRERRRIALGLPVRSPADWLDLQIDRAFVFPIAHCYLSRCLGPLARRIWLDRADDADPALAHTIALGKFEANDPLGQNVFALVMRRLFYENPASQAGLWFDLNPFALGRKVARHGGQTPQGAGEAMLAALQIDFLESIPAIPQQGRS